MSYWWYVIPTSYFVSQNNFYGWNGRAASESELIADGITMLLFVLVGIGTIGNKS